MYNKKTYLAMLVAATFSHQVYAEAADASEANVEQISIVGKSTAFANSVADEAMVNQQSNISSVLAVIDNLPGVLINEGDTFGADDWSTSISIRGFQVDLSQQQIGITIDGIANGNSNYGGGAKANRYIDTENLGTVEVSQGTADISSRSNEALGGTLDFSTYDPTDTEQVVTSVSLGDFGAQKYFVRYETGEIFKDTYAWVSVSSRESSDWMDGVAENQGDHMAAKVVSITNNGQITAYLAYDDVHEDNYQRIYGLEQYAQNPEWDQLTSDWSGIPYVDQAYRRGWSTLRENLFGYLQGEWDFAAVSVKANVYFHQNEGRGDWVPPYLVDVTDNGTEGHSELIGGNTALGGAALGQIYFVDGSGNTLSPIAGCESSLTFPYGGGGAQFDPACHVDNAIPVGSYRHTHYQKDRYGFNADFIWDTQIGDFNNTLRGGIWYEDYNREEYRDWHKIIDSKTSFRFDHRPYWIQYDREFPVETLMYYLQNDIDLEFATVSLGVKKFNVDVSKNDNFNAVNDLDVSSDSDALLSFGVVAPVSDSVELFAGYQENFAAIKDAVLERDDADVSIVEPETAENMDFGLRYTGDSLNASITYYSIEFDNRIRFVSNETVDGIDFLESAAGGYINDGGVESSGIEASLKYQMTDNWSFYTSFTSNDSEYTDADIAGNTVLGSAEELFVFSFDWAKDDYFAGLSTKHVGDRFLNQENTVEVDGYTISDLYIGTNVALSGGVENVDVRLTVNNLFDANYLGTVASNAAWLGAPRTAVINVQVTF